MIAATTSQTAPHESVRAHPIRWKPEGAAAWSEPDHGFYIELRADEPPESRYLAAWGEGDAESFDALEAAQEWCQELIDGWVRRNALITTGIDALHPDDVAVDRFAAAMKAKLADARAKGRGGWEEAGIQLHLSDLLRGHVEKGDPRDVANFCCFLWNRGEGIAPAAVAGGDDPGEFGVGIEPNPKARYWQGRADFWRGQAIALGYSPEAAQPVAGDAIHAALRFLGELESVGNTKAAEIARGLRNAANPEAGRPMDSAPRDGTMVRLLVQFDDHATEDTAGPAWTIGSCNDDNVPEDQWVGWQFAGWCWAHDHFTEGRGTPVGWLPMLGPAAQRPGAGQVTEERCESGLSTCGPVVSWDPEGVGACAKCAIELGWIKPASGEAP